MPRKSTAQRKDSTNGAASHPQGTSTATVKAATSGRKRRAQMDREVVTEGAHQGGEFVNQREPDSLNKAGAAPEQKDDRSISLPASGTGSPVSDHVFKPVHVPTETEVKSELWRIATGEGSEASRVSALRALADIMGLMRATPPEFPEAMSAYMDALAEGLAKSTEK